MSAFELRRLDDYSDEALLQELRRVAEITGAQSLTRRVFRAHSKAGASTIARRFGGWKHALDRAGLGEHYSGVHTVAISSDSILEEVRRVAHALGKDSFTAREFNDHGRLSAGTARRAFGSWAATLAAAGLQRPPRRRPSEAECFENLLRLWTHYGRQPSPREIGHPPSEIGLKPYLSRWGTWRNAVKAFIAQADEEAAPPKRTIAVARSDAPQPPRSPRDISLGLRWRVLQRDRFRCVKCGNSPATQLDCVLHVDHIVPWALGGETVFNNLQTTCLRCNLGKGGRQETA